MDIEKIINAEPVTLTRTVTTSECSWLAQDLTPGTVVHLYPGHTYGCITPTGIAVSVEPCEAPFFELPLDALA